MINFRNAVRAWGTADFEQTLKAEIRALDTEALPLQQGLSHSSHVCPRPVEAVVLKAEEQNGRICVKTAIFYAGITAGSCCADDPTPVNEQSEYCELQFVIDIDSGDATVSLL